MASPTVVGTPAETAISTAGTSHVVNLPAGAVGGMMVAIMSKGSAGTTPTVNALTGWTELIDEAQTLGLYAAYRWVDGTEGATTTFTLSSATRGAWIVYEISGVADPGVVAPQIGTTASGTSATPDPPASAAPPSSKDYLFIAFAGMAGEEADDDTWGNTPPTNYTPSPPRQKSCGTAGASLGGLILSAERALTTGSAENPGTFGVDVSAAWRANTITLHPAVATTTGTAKLSLASGSTPPTRTVHKIKVRARITSLHGVLRVALYEGASDRIGGAGYLEQTLTTSLADYTLAIADADAANITDYSNLDIWVWGYSAGGGSVVYEVDQVWLEIPGSTGTTYERQNTIAAGGVVTGASAKSHEYVETGVVNAGGIVKSPSQRDRARTGLVNAGGLLKGFDNEDRVETGTLPGGGVLTGARIRDKPRSGLVNAGGVLTGARIRDKPRSGLVNAGGLVAGPSQKTGGASLDKTGVVPGGGLVSGFDNEERAETGAVTAGGVASAARVREAPRTGGVNAGGLVKAARVREAPRTGLVTAGGLPTGASQKIGGTNLTKAGLFNAGGVLLGFDNEDRAETGTVTAGGVASGFDNEDRAETGTINAGGVQSGASQKQAGGVNAKSGLVNAGGVTSAEARVEWVETGIVNAGGLLRATDAWEHAKTGLVNAGGLVTGAGRIFGTTRGTVTAGGVVKAADVWEHRKTGTLPAGGVVAGSKSRTAARAGHVTTGGVLRAVWSTLTEGVFTIVFGPPSPSGGAGDGSPSARTFKPSPSGGAGAGSPDARKFKPGSPGRKRT